MNQNMMFARRVLTLVVGTLLVSGLGYAGPSVQIPYTAQETYSIDYGPATVWIDGEGVQHVRGAIYNVTATGAAGGLPVAAVGIGELDINLNLQTGNGDAHTTLTYEITWGDWILTAQGHGSTTYTAWQWESSWNLPHGAGDLAGAKMRGTSWGVAGAGTFETEGVIHLPHGMPGGSPVNNGDSTSWGAIKASFK